MPTALSSIVALSLTSIATRERSERSRIRSISCSVNVVRRCPTLAFPAHPDEAGGQGGIDEVVRGGVGQPAQGCEGGDPRRTWAVHRPAAY